QALGGQRRTSVGVHPHACEVMAELAAKGGSQGGLERFPWRGERLVHRGWRRSLHLGIRVLARKGNSLGEHSPSLDATLAPPRFRRNVFRARAPSLAET